MVGWPALVLILEAVVAVLARLRVGLIVRVIGSNLANLASQVLLSSGLALLARVATIGFAVARLFCAKNAPPPAIERSAKPQTQRRRFGRRFGAAFGGSVTGLLTGNRVGVLASL